MDCRGLLRPIGRDWVWVRRAGIPIPSLLESLGSCRVRMWVPGGRLGRVWGSRVESSIFGLEVIRWRGGRDRVLVVLVVCPISIERE